MLDLLKTPIRVNKIVDENGRTALDCHFPDPDKDGIKVLFRTIFDKQWIKGHIKAICSGIDDIKFCAFHHNDKNKLISSLHVTEWVELHV